MSEKRRDNRNRILRSGESQRKDGRYAYKYTDTFGKVQFVYAWKLVPTDKTPAGKRDDISIREKEKEIQKDLDDGIDTIGKKMIVCELYAKQITINGYSNFLFLNRDGCPKTNVNYATMFRGLAKKYNKCHEEALPKVMTPHTLRHTFCTNLANAGMNPKALQYIMGHSNITMTLNYYAHATFASAKAEMERLIAA